MFKRITYHLFFISFDILFFIGLAHVMIPKIPLLILFFLNFGLWLCYYVIYLKIEKISKNHESSIAIPAYQTKLMSHFIHTCGVHHRLHYPLMGLVMSSFMGMSLFSISPTLVSWISIILLIAVDLHVFIWSAISAYTFK